MKRGIILIALLSLCTAAQSQIRREVEVTRPYEPSVDNALKLNIMPDMTDTVQLRPDFRYEIVPRPLDYGFPVEPIAPARFMAADERTPLPFYAKLGAGYPFQTVADLRFARALGERVRAGAFATHYGRWARIENDMGISEKSDATDNRIGAFIDFRPVEELFFNLDAGYDYRAVYRYGYFRSGLPPSEIDKSADMMKQNFQNLKAKLAFGTSGQPVNIRIGAGVDYFMDRYKYDQVRYDLGFRFDFGAGEYGRMSVDGNAYLTGGTNNLKGHKNRIVRLEASYAYEKDGLRFRLGAGFGYSESTPGRTDRDSSRFAFMPSLLVEKELAGGRFTPFLQLDGDVIDNSFGKLTERNPYLYSGQSAPNTFSYSGRAGVKGTLGSVFRYRLYGGYTQQKDATFWANAYAGTPSAADGSSNSGIYPFYGNEGNVFTVLSDDLNFFEAGADFQADLLNAFSWTGALRYRSYSPDTFKQAWGMPELTFETGIAYRHRDRLYLSLEVEYIGRRQMYSNLGSSGAVNVLPGQANLKFGADYFVTPRFGIFLNLDNLLDHNIYEFNRYRELGVNGRAGVKISF